MTKKWKQNKCKILKKGNLVKLNYEYNWARPYFSLSDCSETACNDIENGTIIMLMGDGIRYSNLFPEVYKLTKILHNNSVGYIVLSMLDENIC